MSILITNGTIVLKDKEIKADIKIRDTKIYKIGLGLKPDDEDSIVIDAKGLHIMAGFVDMHCHLREPGQTHKEDIQSGTLSALQGGFTTVCCMPNTNPVIDNVPLVSYVVARANEYDNAKVYPIGAITKGSKGKELAELKLMANAGAVAFSDDGLPVSDGNIMKMALEYADTFDLLLISHSENKDISLDGVVNEGFNATVSGLKGIPRTAEEAMVARDILLAEACNTKVHIAHISTKTSVALVRDAKRRGVKVTAETCPHYFSATDDEIVSFNTNAKINPPLRTESDVEAIIEGLVDGTIDAIATDHAPHHVDEKNKEFNLAPFGSSGFETAFAVSYSRLVKEKHMTLCELSKKLSANPSAILKLGGGVIKEDETADIVVVNLDHTYSVDSRKFISKGKNSVFNGWTLTGAVTHTIVDGELKEIKNYDR